MRFTPVAVLVALAGLLQAQETSLPRPENLVTFDPLTARLERREDHWFVTAGDGLIKDCGRREEDARLVWRLLGQLGLSQRGVVGGNQPIMEYWLAAGEAPTALPRGLRVLPINLADLRLEQSQGCWVLRESARVLFNFGPDEKEANQALAIMQKYRFNRVGIVGQAVPVMMIFIAHPDGSGSRVVAPQKHVPLKAPDKPGGQQAADFYPTPILPPIHSELENRQPTMLIERGRPTRTASKGSPDAVPQVAVLGSDSKQTFDYRQAQVRNRNGDWILAIGGQVLAEFGSSYRHVQLAQAVLLHYRLTEVHAVGSPQPVARYFLASGQAPRGLMVGVLGEHFQTDRVMTRQSGEHWYVADGARLVLDCGPNQADAEMMVQAIRRYQFDHVCRIGPNDRECLTILVRSY